MPCCPPTTTTPARRNSESRASGQPTKRPDHASVAPTAVARRRSRLSSRSPHLGAHSRCLDGSQSHSQTLRDAVSAGERALAGSSRTWAVPQRTRRRVHPRRRDAHPECCCTGPTRGGHARALPCMDGQGLPPERAQEGHLRRRRDARAKWRPGRSSSRSRRQVEAARPAGAPGPDGSALAGAPAGPTLVALLPRTGPQQFAGGRRPNRSRAGSPLQAPPTSLPTLW